MNFGVLEVANSTAAPAPGWAYVADTGAKGSTTALQPRKRARNQAASSLHETTARQETKILRELAVLDRENHKDVSIPIPVRHRDNAGREPLLIYIRMNSKPRQRHHPRRPQDPPVPKDLLQPPHRLPSPRPNPISHSPYTRPPRRLDPRAAATPRTAPTNLTSKGTRSHKKKDPSAVSTPTPLRRVSAAVPQPIKVEPDTPMPDALSLTLSQGSSNPPVPHPDDNSPLLVSRIPRMPSQAELEKLLSAPPLSYEDARGSWTAEDRRKPVRVFCEVCGYWGRVRCMRCGGKVCALECLNTHQEECFTRYGA
ncbi:hypothetical protein LOCC1_G003246 [Lachnellula occidentalis]|uniref:HIT-type domain-containing protein n=1 Tax=Lachnellula occidentalis TaxID=215460 RepID=A0A8H8RY72_9HELO|nr:hypothetical protein LOCC1_G003246 [Lachnellula occidentalis]